MAAAADWPRHLLVGISFHYFRTTQRAIVRFSVAQAFSSDGEGFPIKGGKGCRSSPIRAVMFTSLKTRLSSLPATFSLNMSFVQVERPLGWFCTRPRTSMPPNARGLRRTAAGSTQILRPFSCQRGELDYENRYTVSMGNDETKRAAQTETSGLLRLLGPGDLCQTSRSAPAWRASEALNQAEAPAIAALTLSGRFVNRFTRPKKHGPVALLGSRTKLTQHWADRIDHWLDPKKVMPIKGGAQA